MTGRELIKQLESCDLDKEVYLVISVISEGDEQLGIVVRDLKYVSEEDKMIGIG